MPVRANDWPGTGPWPIPRVLGPTYAGPFGKYVRNGTTGFFSARNSSGNLSPITGLAKSGNSTPTGNRYLANISTQQAGSGTTVSGTVYDSNGNPQSGVTVRLHDDNSGMLLGQATSDGSGNFSIPAAGSKLTYVLSFPSGFNASVFDQVVPL